jgi:hypothetical protein
MEAKASCSKAVYLVRSLPMCCQISGGVLLFLLGRGSETALVVDKHNPGRLEEDQHIRLVVAVDISELQRHRGLIRVGTKQLRAKVNARMRTIATGEFDDFNFTV